MQDKEIQDIQLYAKAFDAGYKIMLYNKELYEKIEHVFKDKKDEYSIGFLKGVDKAIQEIEQKKDQLVEKNREELQNIRNRNQNKEKGIDR